MDLRAGFLLETAEDRADGCRVKHLRGKVLLQSLKRNARQQIPVHLKSRSCGLGMCN